MPTIIRKPAFVFFVAMHVIALDAHAARRRAVAVSPSPDALRAPIVAIAGNVLATYERADFSVAWRKMDEEPSSAVNPLYIVIPIARASALVVLYENGARDAQAIDDALELLEFAVARHEQWGHSWVTASVVNMLDLTIHRMRGLRTLPPQTGNRIELLWQRALDITRFEADVRLAWNMPVPPFDSTTAGDTQAEEFAWEASLLTAAAVFLPDHPNAPRWERKARQLAYDAITRPSDPPDLEGIKTTTVSEEFRLDNHGIAGNPYYAAATLQLLQQAELPYRMTRRAAPPELHHNFWNLHRVYETYIDEDEHGRLVWNRASDHGDPSLIPIAKAGDPGNDLRLAMQKAASGTLWRAPLVSEGVIPEAELYTAIQNHKVAWYYIVGLYWWYWPH
ncbi:MAG TPA: hypothetical protein VNA69_22685 [Thermoanaerobaculia bacterium]|nr:hypothetical protein [Thermoanaerobaculia bacterium]